MAQQQRTVSWSKEIDEQQHVVEETYDAAESHHHYYDNNNNNDDYHNDQQYFHEHNNDFSYTTDVDTVNDTQNNNNSNNTKSRNNRRNSSNTTGTGTSSRQSPVGDDNNNNNSNIVRCPNCSSTAIEQHDASGSSICTECGVVVEENMIVSSVDFVEGAGGSASMVGHFVSATSTKAYTGGKRSSGGSSGAGRYGYSRESREQTLQNARRRIQDVASRMRLGTQTVDAAHRLYVIALERNFVLGRKSSHVTAACLYIACRQQKLQYMLIDFSDALQVNVFAIGTTFLKFRRMFGLKLELIDPALYIYRFAAHLDLDEAANTVAMTALRLVARMKRDWIQTGRRPAGICAAALLIAARAHGFHKEHQDVTKILRVCGMTVNTRVREFEQTASAQLTLEQFQDDQFDFQHESDPPIFTRNRLMEARAKAILEGNVELLESGVLDDPIQSNKHKARWRNLDKLQQKSEKLTSVYNALVNTLAPEEVDCKDDNAKDGIIASNDKVDGGDGNDDDDVPIININNGNDLDQELDLGACYGNDDLPRSTDKTDSLTIAKHIENQNDGEDDKGCASTRLEKLDEVSHEKTLGANEVISHKGGQKDLVDTNALTVIKTPLPEIWKKAYPSSKYGKTITLAEHATEEEQLPSTTETEGVLSLTEWKLSIPESIDLEIDSMFRSEEEEKQKEAIFNKINAEYIEQQKQKLGHVPTAEQRNDNDDNGGDGNGDVVVLHPAEPQKRKYNTKRSRGIVDGVGTTEEQLMAAVSNRKVSRRINYDALSSIFDEDGSFLTDVVVAGPSQSNVTNVYPQMGEVDFDQQDESELFAL